MHHRLSKQTNTTTTTMTLRTAILCVALYLNAARSFNVPFNVQTPDRYEIQDVKVPLVLGVMSQCPDALLCESVIDRVLQQVEDKVDLSLTFIGRYVSVVGLLNDTNPRCVYISASMHLNQTLA